MEPCKHIENGIKGEITQKHLDDLTYKIIGCAIEVHKQVSPGLLETKYKQDVFALCNEMGTKKTWKELDLDFPDKKVEFQVVFEDEWKSRINKIFQ